MRAIKSQAIAIVLALSTMLFALSFYAFAQQPKKIPRLGYVTSNSSAAISIRTEAFRQGLRELGYVEGKNILVELRSSDGKLDALRGIADELVRLKVNVIVTGGGGVTGPVKDATSTIPIVMSQDSDPVDNGFVASLARPGAISLDSPFRACQQASRYSQRGHSETLAAGYLRHVK